MMGRRLLTVLLGASACFFGCGPITGQAESRPPGLRVGAAAASFEADDSMEIAGSILPGKATGQEGQLRAVAVVLEKKPDPKAVERLGKLEREHQGTKF